MAREKPQQDPYEFGIGALLGCSLGDVASQDNFALTMMNATTGGNTEPSRPTAVVAADGNTGTKLEWQESGKGIISINDKESVLTDLKKYVYQKDTGNSKGMIVYCKGEDTTKPYSLAEIAYNAKMVEIKISEMLKGSEQYVKTLKGGS